MIDFNKNVTQKTLSSSANTVLQRPTPSKQKKTNKKIKKLRINKSKKRLTKENKLFLKLIGL